MATTKIKSKVTVDGQLAFPSDYIGAVDLKGKDWTLTIAAVSIESLKMREGGEKKKLVLRFNKTAKKLVCNRTNADAIASATGASEAKQWVGKTIIVYPTRCPAFGEIVDCVRVRPARSGQSYEPPHDPDQDTGYGMPPQDDAAPQEDSQPGDVAGDGGTGDVDEDHRQPEPPESPPSCVRVNGMDMPEALSPDMRKKVELVDRFVEVAKPQEVSRKAALTAFHARHKPRSFEALSPGEQDEHWSALIGGQVDWAKK